MDMISREDAERVTHDAIFDQCMKDSNTCAGDYSYHALQAIRSIPPIDIGEAEGIVAALNAIGEADMYEAPASTKATLDKAVAIISAQAGRIAELESRLVGNISS